MKKTQKILFVHYRTGERDGVSLEIEKRAKILQALGAEVYFLSGFDGLDRENAKIIPLIDLRTSYNTFLRENAFYRRLFDETTMLFLYSQLENKFANRINKYLSELQPDLIFVHNVFSHAYNLPFTTALLKILDQHQFPTIAVNHDFWFEREQFRHPKYGFVKTILESLPPNRPYIRMHQTINSRASREVLKRRNIKTVTTGDYFDFDTPTPKVQRETIDSMLQDLDIDTDRLIILHATRVTARKAIELAIMYASELEKRLRKLSKPFTFRGKNITNKTKITLLFPNFIEVDALTYWHLLKNYAAHLDIDVVWAYEHFSLQATEADGIGKYSFWDSYAAADIVTYTSIEEGFGNQFLEAIYYRKLPVVFEYPVFEIDIKKEGYQYVTLGNSTRLYRERQVVPPEVMKNAVKRTLEYLQNQDSLKDLTDNNFELGRQHHPTTVLEEGLADMLRKL